MVRIAPLVPMVTATSPSLIAPTPILDNTPSLAPMTNLVPKRFPFVLLHLLIIQLLFSLYKQAKIIYPLLSRPLAMLLDPKSTTLSSSDLSQMQWNNQQYIAETVCKTHTLLYRYIFSSFQLYLDSHSPTRLFCL